MALVPDKPRCPCPNFPTAQQGTGQRSDMHTSHGYWRHAPPWFSYAGLEVLFVPFFFPAA
jgi:hypothetical protein